MRAIHDTELVTKIASNCNIKKDAAKLAQEQSSHLFLCVLIDDLTKRYGPVVRSSTVIGVLDSAFDIIIPEFGIEKRVHTDQMPLDVSLPYPLYTQDQSLMRLVCHRAMITMNPLILSLSIGKNQSTSSHGLHRTTPATLILHPSSPLVILPERLKLPHQSCEMDQSRSRLNT
jgi:hypothetical protein